MQFFFLCLTFHKLCKSFISCKDYWLIFLDQNMYLFYWKFQPNPDNNRYLFSENVSSCSLFIFLLFKGQGKIKNSLSLNMWGFFKEREVYKMYSRYKKNCWRNNFAQPFRSEQKNDTGRIFWVSIFFKFRCAF